MCKDLLRDTFDINGSVFNGDEGLDAIIGTLASSILEMGSANGITEAEALAFAREVMYESNRTQFGGDAYEAVDLVCCNHNLVFITPHAQQSNPVRFSVSGSNLDVDIAPGRDGRRTPNSVVSSDDGEDDTRGRKGSVGEQLHKLLTVDVRASMAFNVNALDIDTDSEAGGGLVWAKIDAAFERTFVFAGEHPMP